MPVGCQVSKRLYILSNKHCPPSRLTLGGKEYLLSGSQYPIPLPDFADLEDALHLPKGCVLFQGPSNWQKEANGKFL